jgi:hypothetical protein
MRFFPGLCVGFACTAPSVSPVPRKRDGVVLEASPAVPHLACPVGLIPCPVYPKGFEVRLFVRACSNLLVSENCLRPAVCRR